MENNSLNENDGAGENGDARPESTGDEFLDLIRRASNEVARNLSREEAGVPICSVCGRELTAEEARRAKILIVSNLTDRAMCLECNDAHRFRFEPLPEPWFHVWYPDRVEIVQGVVQPDGTLLTGPTVCTIPRDGQTDEQITATVFLLLYAPRMLDLLERWVRGYDVDEARRQAALLLASVRGYTEAGSTMLNFLAAPPSHPRES